MAPTETKKWKNEEDEDTLDWISLRKEINADVPPPEGLREKIIRKTSENPFVPIGCLGTAGILSYGLWCMRTGQTKRSQMMMRLRVIAQGATVAGLLVGVMVAASKKTDNKNTT